MYDFEAIHAAYVLSVAMWLGFSFPTKFLFHDYMHLFMQDKEQSCGEKATVELIDPVGEERC